MSVGVGIIGMGWMGQIHARLALKIDGCQLKAVCDAGPASKDRLSSDFGVPCYTDHREMLEREDIEAVYIATPPTVRYDLIRDCIDAQKHILCEKPLAVEAAELARVSAAVANSKKHFMMCFPERFTVSFQEAKAVVDRGQVGDIDYVRANFRFSMKKHGTLHGAWVFDRSQGGGLILESSVHMWDAIRWITGKEITEVVGIARELKGSGRVFEDNFVAIARLENGGMACVDMSGTLPKDTPTDKRFEILGADGCVYVDEFRHFLTVNSEKGVEANPGDFVSSMTYPDIMWHSPIAGGVKRLQEEFIRSVTTGRKPVPDVNDGVRASLVASAIVRSLQSGRFEEVKLGT